MYLFQIRVGPALLSTPSPSPSPSASTSPSVTPSPSPAAAGVVLSAVKIADGTGGLPANTLADEDTFGSPSPIGDLNGDGIPDIVVHSALHDEPGYTNNGAAYVLFLHRNGTVKHF